MDAVAAPVKAQVCLTPLQDTDVCGRMLAYADVRSHRLCQDPHYRYSDFGALDPRLLFLDAYTDKTKTRQPTNIVLEHH